VTAALPLVPATPRPEEGVVSFNVNTACNYRCSYCTQRFKEDRGRWSRDTPRFLRAFARLPGRWEIKISGGEPFVHPTLNELVGGIARLGHRVGVVTNFSASRDKLAAFVDAASGRVSMLSCSLHLEYVDDVDAFIEKAVFTRGLLDGARADDVPAPSVHVTCVATRANLPVLARLGERFRAAGLVFKVQPEKQNRDVIDYAPNEREALIALGGHNLTGMIEPSFEGLPCWAGSRYFILDDEGVAYRCYPARRYKQERIGDFLAEDFRLLEQASPCLYRYCNCTVPIARGMMPRAPTLQETEG
jgi:MoaA/NifB/PqqE/SkfB family radical SAM enzyme